MISWHCQAIYNSFCETAIYNLFLRVLPIDASVLNICKLKRFIYKLRVPWFILKSLSLSLSLSPSLLFLKQAMILWSVN
jgi:hypothetical protein